jgi:phosphate transport system ATP-binding protein
MHELVERFTLVIVTHNLAQAERLSSRVAFFSVEPGPEDGRTGVLVEAGETEQVFAEPTDSRTRDYLRSSRSAEA